VLIESDRVSLVYLAGSPFESRALEEVSLKVSQGRILGLIGTTGSGKSSFLQALAGLEQPTSGKFVYPEDFSRKRLFEKVGTLFQMPEDQLFETTVLEDVAFGPRRLGWDEDLVLEGARQALRLVGIDPDQYGSRSPLALSGGEKRRVATAGILAMNPTLLLLDEPTAGLDRAGKDRLHSVIRDLKARGVTLLVITHDLDYLAQIADDVVVFENGALVLSGSAFHVLTDEAALERAGLKAPFSVRLHNRLVERGVLERDDGLDLDRLGDRISAYLEARKSLLSVSGAKDRKSRSSGGKSGNK